jgi:hypothetical protein
MSRPFRSLRLVPIVFEPDLAGGFGVDLLTGRLARINRRYQNPTSGLDTTRIACAEVKFVDIGKNTGGEGGDLVLD